MLVLLPFAAYLAVFWVLRLRGEGWRSAALGAAVGWGVFLALITEILSVPPLDYTSRFVGCMADICFDCVWLWMGVPIIPLPADESSWDESKGEDRAESNAQTLDGHRLAAALRHRTNCRSSGHHGNPQRSQYVGCNGIPYVPGGAMDDQPRL